MGSGISINISLDVVIGLLLIVLLVCSILAVLKLLSLLKNANKAVESASKLLEENRDELDVTVKTLPDILHKADTSLLEVNRILMESSADITGSISEVKDTLSNVSRLTSDAATGVEYAAQRVVDTADMFSSGAKKGNQVMNTVKEIAEIAKGFLAK
ncbi:MAG: hypothetical protein SOW48_04645 [Peptoniphilaceae bacterium]|nr:hypothetical protein [Peptoniphilaceae bacterium]MCI6659881.1 hypothetical protein [Peptoniphilaceae bacterium]MDD7434313.1 hypothetical protein [Peptoniphilaceae bacterium]MDY3075917.1 hypothetical protein [Peptoniphilaceae bacterium]MDY3987162.1 hypothetical protein [Peptoniphilaceae bacterium]